MITFTFIESPYAPAKDQSAESAKVQVETHLTYLRAAMRDCFKRGEIPLASHALYTQPGVLDDTLPAERLMGMEAGFSLRAAMAQLPELGHSLVFPDAIMVQTAVYEDLGVSPGMERGVARSVDDGVPVVFRSLPDWVTS